MTESITGAVKHQRVNSDKGYISLLVDDDWYNMEFDGPETSAPEFKGQVVEVRYRDTDDFINVEEVRNVSDSSNSESKGSDDLGEASSSISRSEQIKVNTAFQQAVETVREKDEDLDRGQHFKEVEKLTNGYYNVLDSQMKDKADGDME